MTTTIVVRTSSSWRMIFYNKVSAFFRIKPDDWQAATGKQIKNLDPNLTYSNDIHEAFTIYLNHYLFLSPLLKTSDFKGDDVLGVFRETEIKTRVPSELKSQTVLVLPDHLASASQELAHLSGVTE